MDVTRVSIVIATCDRPGLLVRALASVAAQERADGVELEVIVIDDAGSEPVDEPVAGIRAREESAITDLVLLRNDVNRGRSASRNRAIAAATGDLVGFLDDDDLLHPAHVRLLVAEARTRAEPTIVVAGSQAVLETPEGFELSRSEHDDGGEVRHDLLLLRNLFPIQAALVPRSALAACGGFDESLEVLEDWDLWLRLAQIAPMHRIDHVTSEYRHRTGKANSLTRESAQYLLNVQRIYERHPLAGRTDAAVLERLRADILAAARRRLPDAWQFDRSVVALLGADADPATLMQLLGRIVDEQDSLGGTWELVLALPRTSELVAAMQAVEGDLVAHWYPPSGAGEVAVADLRRRALGREVALDRSLEEELDSHGS